MAQACIVAGPFRHLRTPRMDGCLNARVPHASATSSIQSRMIINHIICRMRLDNWFFECHQSRVATNCCICLVLAMDVALSIALASFAYVWQGAAHRQAHGVAFVAAALVYLFAGLLLWRCYQLQIGG